MPARLYPAHQLVTCGPWLSLGSDIFDFWGILTIHHLNSQKILLWKSGFLHYFRVSITVLQLSNADNSGSSLRRGLFRSPVPIPQFLRLSSSRKKTPNARIFTVSQPPSLTVSDWPVNWSIFSLQTMIYSIKVIINMVILSHGDFNTKIMSKLWLLYESRSYLVHNSHWHKPQKSHQTL